MKRYHRTLILSFLLWTVCFASLVYLNLFHPILKEDSSKYVKYRSSKEQKTPVAIFQFRQGVSKDLWISSKENRVYCHIESPSSDLHFDLTHTNPSLVETLSQLKIWIQEPHEVKYLRATSGDFNYSNHTLATHEAFLSAYKLTNQANTIFSCLAKDLTITFDESPLAFTASGFSAHLQSGGSL